MICSEDVFYIGKVSRVRGISGEVEILFTDDAFDRGDAEYLVMDMDGILVPFFWEEYRFKNDKTAIFRFEHITDETAARHIVGAKVYYPKDHLPDNEDEDGLHLRSWQALTGFDLYDARGKEHLGSVLSVDDSTANILMTVAREDGGECYLPFHEDFLVDADMKGRRLMLDLPPGLLEING